MSAAPLLVRLTRAAGKSFSARLRDWGSLSTAPAWQERAEICERCPLRVIRDGICFCGPPLLQKLDRDPTLDGCGCPTHAKAKDPTEHCPLTPRHTPSARSGGQCDCKWCAVK